MVVSAVRAGLIRLRQRRLGIPSPQFRGPARETRTFLAAARKLLGPRLTAVQLFYDQCGLRPKIWAPHETQEKDFVISEDKPGFFNFLGIESPGLTSALAIAEFTRGQIV